MHSAFNKLSFLVWYKSCLFYWYNAMAETKLETYMRSIVTSPTKNINYNWWTISSSMSLHVPKNISTTFWWAYLFCVVFFFSFFYDFWNVLRIYKVKHYTCSLQIHAGAWLKDWLYKQVVYNDFWWFLKCWSFLEIDLFHNLLYAGFSLFQGGTNTFSLCYVLKSKF